MLMVEKAKDGQKNFALGAGKAAFESWCTKNGYDHKSVFLAGWLLLTRISHEERMDLFEEIGPWASAGYPNSEAKPGRVSITTHVGPVESKHRAGRDRKKSA